MNEQECKYLIGLMHSGSTKGLNEFLLKHPDALRTPLCPLGKYAIHYAASVGQTATIRYICELQPGLIDLKDNYQQTALIFAASFGRNNTVDFLISRGADLNAQSVVPTNPDCNLSVINWARAGNHTRCVSLILQEKLSIIKKKLLLACDDPTKITAIIYQGVKECIEDQNTDAINYLLTNRPDHFQTLDTSQRLELLSLTLEECNVQSIKLFIERQIWPPTVSAEGYNLIQWAVVNGHTQLVDILLGFGADIKQTFNNPEHPDHGMNLIKLAYIHSSPDMMNLIILKLWPHLKDSECKELLFYVQTGLQALDLAATNSRLQHYLMKDKRINKLISKELVSKSSADKPQGYYSKTPTRPISFYAHKHGKKLFLDKKEEKIGEGLYGNVYRVNNQVDSSSLAVKSFQNSDRSDVEREARFFASIYPDTHPPIRPFFNSYQKKSKEILTGRLIMPYFKPATINFATMSVLKVAQHLYMVANELLRIHNIGVIHGDISVDNVLFCADGTVKFIDFGFSYSKNDTFAIVFPHEVYGDTHSRIAPERKCAFQTLAPHTSQDIYTLGWLFDEYISLCSSDCQKQIATIFNSINDFLSNAYNIDPQKRPSLAEFCTSLQNEITEYESLHPQASSSNSYC